MRPCSFCLEELCFAEIVAKVDALKSLKRARTAGDSANESNPTKQTSSMSPSPRPSAAPTQVDRLGGVVERGNGCSLDFTVNPFLKEMQTEPNCTKFGKELPQSTGMSSDVLRRAHDAGLASYDMQAWKSQSHYLLELCDLKICKASREQKSDSLC